MAINLKKGQTINLEKSTHDLSSVTFGLGWKIAEKPQGFFKKLLGGGQEECDLDAIAFVMDVDGKVRNLGDGLKESDVIFYGNLRHPSGCIVHTGDNLEGGSGVEDDEQIKIKLESLDERYQCILFLVTIYEGIKKNQHFGEVKGAFMRAVDANGKEMARFNLDQDNSYDNMRTVVFGEVYRHGSDWKFRAIGDSFQTDQFLEILRKHVD